MRTIRLGRSSTRGRVDDRAREQSDVQQALAKLGTSGRFSIVARDFFSRLTSRSLGYFLSLRAAGFAYYGIGRGAAGGTPPERGHGEEGHR